MKNFSHFAPARYKLCYILNPLNLSCDLKSIILFIASLGIHFSVGTGLVQYVALLCPSHKVSDLALILLHCL